VQEVQEVQKDSAFVVYLSFNISYLEMLKV